MRIKLRVGVLAWLAVSTGLPVGLWSSGADAATAPLDARRANSAPPLSQPRRVGPALSGQRVTTNWDFGCALDHYAPGARKARQLRFRLPIPTSELFGIVPEPAVIHGDRDGRRSGGFLQCRSFQTGHGCYNGHEGTDFSLGGAFRQMGSVRAIAAAPGVVMDIVEDEFDGCHLNPDPQALLDDDVDNNVICPNPDTPESVALTRANRVTLCHADGTITRYLHLMRNSVPNQLRAGSRVSCGEPLGYIGSSGKSAAPHLHFDVLVPESRARGRTTQGGRTYNGRRYRYIDPYAARTRDSLWTAQNYDYAATLTGLPLASTLQVPSLAHPNGHATTLACPHLASPHPSGHPRPKAPCTHLVHGGGDPIMAPCTHPAHAPHGLLPCTHPRHPSGHHLTIGGQRQYRVCTHVAHPSGHDTTVPCTHAPVPQHPNGHPGPTAPCTHLTSTPVAATIELFSLPGPRCDG